MSKNPNILHLIPLNPRIKIFPKYGTHSNDAPYCPLPSYKKLETFNDQFPRYLKTDRRVITMDPIG